LPAHSSPTKQQAPRTQHAPSHPPSYQQQHPSVKDSDMALRRLVPLLDRVLVERITAPTKTAGGVLLPESVVTKVRRARCARLTGHWLPSKQRRARCARATGRSSPS
jgi:hypothetical protein